MKLISSSFGFLSAVVIVSGCSMPSSGDAKKSDTAITSAPVVTTPASTAVKHDMKDLKAVAAGWEGEYNAALSSWTFEKYTPGSDGINKPNRVYIGAPADDSPVTADAFAAKLQTKDWQDSGYVYSKITDKKALADGFVVAGLVADTSDATAKPMPGFVMIRDASGMKIRCKSGVLVSDALRTEAEALCSNAKF